MIIRQRLCKQKDGGRDGDVEGKQKDYMQRERRQCGEFEKSGTFFQVLKIDDNYISAGELKINDFCLINAVPSAFLAASVVLCSSIFKLLPWPPKLQLIFSQQTHSRLGFEKREASRQGHPTHCLPHSPSLSLSLCVCVSGYICLTGESKRAHPGDVGPCFCLESESDADTPHTQHTTHTHTHSDADTPHKHHTTHTHSQMQTHHTHTHTHTQSDADSTTGREGSVLAGCHINRLEQCRARLQLHKSGPSCGGVGFYPTATLLPEA